MPGPSCCRNVSVAPPGLVSSRLPPGPRAYARGYMPSPLRGCAHTNRPTKCAPSVGAPKEICAPHRGCVFFLAPMLGKIASRAFSGSAGSCLAKARGQPLCAAEIGQNPGMRRFEGNRMGHPCAKERLCPAANSPLKKSRDGHRTHVLGRRNLAEGSQATRPRELWSTSRGLYVRIGTRHMAAKLQAWLEEKDEG